MIDVAGEYRYPLDVVVSGMGVVCAVAANVEEFVVALRQGTVGLQSVTMPDSDRKWMAGVVSSPLPPQDPVWPGLEVTRHEHLAITAARQAMASAALGCLDLNDGDIGVYVAACQGGLTAQATTSPTFTDRAATHGLNSLAETVAVALGVVGPRVVTSNACSASASAIAVAAEELTSGRIRVALVGGADALERFTLEGFGSLASLDPSGCSPYHRSAGLSVGEGAGFLVLERTDNARDRGVTIRGRLLGWGASADAYHPTAPDPTGRGAATAVERALVMADCDSSAIDYISGHGTGTITNDSMELRGFSSVFGASAPPPRLSSTKSMIGHTLGAASVIESIATLLGMEGGFYPPTAVADVAPLSLTGCVAFDVVPGEAAQGSLRRSIKTSYAFGGANYSLVWGRANVQSHTSHRPRTASSPRRRAVVTGLGVLGPAGATIEDWARVIGSGTCVLRPLPVGRHESKRRRVLVGLCPDLGERRPASMNAWRRMDRLSRRCLVTAHAALEDAKIDRADRRRESMMILLSTAAGPISTLLEYRAQMTEPKQRRLAALFPNTALNAAAGHVATSLGLRGGIASFTSGALSSDLALRHAVDLIENCRCDQVLVIAAEELNRAFVELVADSATVSLTEEAVVPFSEPGRGIALSEATVCLLLESDASADRRGVPSYGTYLGAGVAGVGDLPTSADWTAAFQRAAAAGSVDLADVDVVYAAAAGLGDRDQGERLALASAFASSTLVVPLKSFLGHALGASGAVGTVAALLSFLPSEDANERQVALVNSASMCGQCFATAWAPGIGERRSA